MTSDLFFWHTFELDDSQAQFMQEHHRKLPWFNQLEYLPDHPDNFNLRFFAIKAKLDDTSNKLNTAWTVLGNLTEHLSEKEAKELLKSNTAQAILFSCLAVHQNWHEAHVDNAKASMYGLIALFEKLVEQSRDRNHALLFLASFLIIDTSYTDKKRKDPWLKHSVEYLTSVATQVFANTPDFLNLHPVRKGDTAELVKRDEYYRSFARHYRLQTHWGITGVTNFNDEALNGSFSVYVSKEGDTGKLPDERYHDVINPTWLQLWQVADALIQEFSEHPERMHIETFHVDAQGDLEVKCVSH